MNYNVAHVREIAHSVYLVYGLHADYFPVNLNLEGFEFAHRAKVGVSGFTGKQEGKIYLEGFGQGHDRCQGRIDQSLLYPSNIAKVHINGIGQFA